jgi:hypothetical protein
MYDRDYDVYRAHEHVFHLSWVSCIPRAQLRIRCCVVEHQVQIDITANDELAWKDFIARLDKAGLTLELVQEQLQQKLRMFVEAPVSPYIMDTIQTVVSDHLRKVLHEI